MNADEARNLVAQTLAAKKEADEKRMLAAEEARDRRIAWLETVGVREYLERVREKIKTAALRGYPAVDDECPYSNWEGEIISRDVAKCLLADGYTVNVDSEWVPAYYAGGGDSSSGEMDHDTYTAWYVKVRW